MSAYRNCLEHLAEPADPSEREAATSVTIEDYEALWVTTALREFAHYGDHDHDEQGEIAVGYASYIDAKVRDEGNSHVTLYVHTDVAAETLMDSLYHHIPESGNRDEYPMAVFRSLEDQFATVMAEYIDFEEDQ